MAISSIVLVSSGTTVYAYNATTGAAVGSFTTSEPVNSIASTETVTVLGSYATNQLQMINLTASLQTGVAQPATGIAQPFTPAAGFTLLGGLTGLPGSTTRHGHGRRDLRLRSSRLRPSSASQAISTARSTPSRAWLQVCPTSSARGPHCGRYAERGLYQLFRRFRRSRRSPVRPSGSIDQSLALVAGAVQRHQYRSTSRLGGTLTLNYADLLTGLSEAFRPDLTSSALIDIQGDVQSIRGGSATGMVLNDNGNLNLVKFASVSNSTIVGQPVSHLQIQKRSHVTILTPSRTAGGRNGVTVDTSLSRSARCRRPND